MNYAVVIPLVVSSLSGIVSILAIFNFVHTRKKEAEEKRLQQEQDAIWRDRVNQQLDQLSRRVDSP